MVTDYMKIAGLQLLGFLFCGPPVGPEFRCDSASITTLNDFHLPRPSSYPQLGPKYPLLGTIYPQLRVQGGSSYKRNRMYPESGSKLFGALVPNLHLKPSP